MPSAKKGERMNRCSKCGWAMIRASAIDPDGLIPLYGGEKEYKEDGSLKEWWVCTNRGCEDGRKNMVDMPTKPSGV